MIIYFNDTDNITNKYIYNLNSFFNDFEKIFVLQNPPPVKKTLKRIMMMIQNQSTLSLASSIVTKP